MTSGFILQHYGQEIVAKELGLSEDHPDVQRVFLTMYKSFVEVTCILQIAMVVHECEC